MSKCSALRHRWFRHSDFVILSDFVIRHSGLRITVCSIQKAGQRTGESGLGSVGSWKAPTSLMPCIGTLNLKRARQCRQQGAADVSSAELFSDSSAGKMPAALWGSWKVLLSASVRLGKRSQGSRAETETRT